MQNGPRSLSRHLTLHFTAEEVEKALRRKRTWVTNVLGLFLSHTCVVRVQCARARSLYRLASLRNETLEVVQSCQIHAVLPPCPAKIKTSPLRGACVEPSK